VIDLPHGGGARINEHELVDFVLAFKPPRSYIIVGASHVALAKYHKKRTLDYWLRQHSQYPDTTQAVESVIDALVATGLFVDEEQLLCPESHRKCRGLRLSEMVLDRINRPERV
jgi:hypothetical protein